MPDNVSEYPLRLPEPEERLTEDEAREKLEEGPTASLSNDPTTSSVPTEHPQWGPVGGRDNTEDK